MDVQDLEKAQAAIRQLLEGVGSLRRSILDVPENARSLIRQILSLPNRNRSPEQQEAIDEAIAAVESWLGTLVLEHGGEFTPATPTRKELFARAEEDLAFYEHNVFSRLKQAFGME